MSENTSLPPINTQRFSCDAPETIVEPESLVSSKLVAEALPKLDDPKFPCKADEEFRPKEPEIPPEDLPPDTSQPPHDRSAEEAVLGSLLINPDCYPEIASILSPADFYIQRNSWIFAAFGRLVKQGEPLDTLTASSELMSMGKLEEIGGPAYLTSLLIAVPSSLNARTYAGKVKDKAVKRRMITLAKEIATKAYDPRVTAEQVSIHALETLQKKFGYPGKRFDVYTGADALEPQPPTEWVVRNLIQTNSVNVIYGDPGSKKTWTGLHLAACVSEGRKWLNFTTEKSPVLFVDEESGQKRVLDRLGHVLRGIGASGENIHCISFACFSLDKPQDLLDLENQIKKLKAKLIIFDALADLMNGDENSKQDVQPIFTALRKISDATGAAIVLIHHSGKNGDYRGSSAIKGAIDLMLEIKSKDESGVVSFTTTKNRDGEKVKFAASATWENDIFTLAPVKLTGQIMSKAEDYVIRFFTTHPDGTIEDCENNADVCKPGTARNTLFSLAGRGLLRRTNTGKIATYALASVTSNERVTDE